MPAREILKQLDQAILDRVLRRDANLGRAGDAVDLFSAPRRVAIGLRPLADAVVENGALVRVAERDRVQAAERGQAQQRARGGGNAPRSEAHTSELQARLHLVCRL